MPRAGRDSEFTQESHRRLAESFPSTNQAQPSGGWYRVLSFCDWVKQYLWVNWRATFRQNCMTGFKVTTISVQPTLYSYVPRCAFVESHPPDRMYQRQRVSLSVKTVTVGGYDPPKSGTLLSVLLFIYIIRKFNPVLTAASCEPFFHAMLHSCVVEKYPISL